MDARVLLELTPCWSGARVGSVSPASDGDETDRSRRVVKAAGHICGSAILRICAIARVRQRLRAAVLPDGDAKLLGFVGEVRRDARTGEYDDADREDVENPVVAFERRRPGVTVPVRLEDNLRHLAVVSPAGGDALCALRTAAVQQHHVGMFGVDFVERVPDRGMILKSRPPVKATLGPAGSSTSVSARRLAARKSRLSTIAAVSVRWLTIEPERGRQVG